MKLFSHLASGKSYLLFFDNIIDATNSSIGRRVVIYQNKNGEIFTRERKEFYQEFEEVPVNDNLICKCKDGTILTGQAAYNKIVGNYHIAGGNHYYKQNTNETGNTTDGHTE